MAILDILIAIDRNDPDELAIVLEHSTAGINELYKGMSPLWHAIKRREINATIVEQLLNAGADPDQPLDGLGYPSEWSAWPLNHLACMDTELARLLIRHGSDPGVLDDNSKRILLDFPESVDPFEDVRISDFWASSRRRTGTSNPEDMTDTYKVAMVRSGRSGWTAREHFLDPFKGGCTRTYRSEDAVWCARRFGQTLSFLNDGEMILIGGEHEDFYDPDFCVYNDVIVVTPDHEVTIYGYPESVFPPTDFHTATLVGNSIYVIGSLGYMDQRGGVCPVYRLDLGDFHIDQCPTFGDVPPRIFNHRAKLIDERFIRIWGGEIADTQDRQPNLKSYVLNTQYLTWSRVD